MRSYLVYLLLLLIKCASKVFWRFDRQWIEAEPEVPWENLRVMALLNHTSLFEPIFVGAAPNQLLRKMSRSGVVPVAQKTLARPFVGRFFRLVGHNVVSITLARDHTWTEVLKRIDDPDALIVIMPEGRMKRPTGLDLHGHPMTVRGGIADILLGIPSGDMLMVYSGGLHHIHAPGERFPRLFRTARLRLELIDIAAYREKLLAEAGERGFKAAVAHDLERRRDLYCPTDEEKGQAA
jgi:1-acyl-sn-glycerol-3-phosphate acyltransferase